MLPNHFEPAGERKGGEKKKIKNKKGKNLTAKEVQDEENKTSFPSSWNDLLPEIHK